MKKMLFTILVIQSCLVAGISQLNETFESWNVASGNPPFNWNYPAGWSTSNPVTEFASFSVLRSVDYHTGNYAALIQSVPVFNQYRAGELLLGDAVYNYVLLTMEAGNGMQLQQIPTKLTGWYKFTAQDSSIRAVIKVAVARSMEGSADSMLLDTKWLLPPVEEYTLFTMDLMEPYPVDVEKDRLFISFSTSEGQHSPGPASLWIDDVQVDFINEVEDDQISSGPYLQVLPSLLKAGEHAKILFDVPLEKSRTMHVINYAGSIVQVISCPRFATEVSIETTTLLPGKYLLADGDGRACASFVIQ